MPTATERFCTVLAGGIPDRVPILLYAMDPQKVRYTIPTMMLKAPESVRDPSHRPTDPNILRVLHRAREVATFVVGVGHPREALLTGAQPEITCCRLPCDNDDYFEWRNTLHTPAGQLSCAELLSDRQLPPHNKEPLLKTIDDIDRLLSIPFEPFDITSEWVHDQRSAFDDRCVILWNVATSPAALLYHYAGAESFSLWTIEYRSRLMRAIEALAPRRLELLDALCSAGAGPVFHTAGFEDFIPPLQSPANLRELILPFERQFCEAVHSRSGYVWAHSHGRVSAFLEDFVEIGADCLQPLEPPPMGDVDFADAKRRIGANIALVGNIQTHDLMIATTDQVRRSVRRTMAEGKPGGRFALSPSAEPIVSPTITDLHRDNLLCYLDEGYAFGFY